MSRLAFVLFLGLALAVTAAPSRLDETRLLKRLLDILETKETAKRALHLLHWDPTKQELAIDYKLCVKGGEDVPCRDVKGHRVQVFNGDGDELFTATAKYLAAHGVYKLDFVQPDAEYKVVACEMTKEDEAIECNEGVFKGSDKTISLGSDILPVGQEKGE